MTIDQNPMSKAGRIHRAGFTMVELLITVGIIVLLVGLLLGGLAIAKKRATEIRVHSDLALIGTALEAYKDGNNGQYPVFADPGTDQASTAIEGNGQWLDYSPNRGAVLLCRALIGPGAASTNPNLASGDTTAYPGDDGADGPGYRVRRIYNATTGQFSGKVYGYYADPSKFKIGYATPPPADTAFPMAYPVMLDINGNPILYYPAAAGNQPNNLPYYDPTTATASSPAAISTFNGYDNEFYLDAKTSSSPFETLSGGQWSGTTGVQSPSWGTPPYLLWTAGADGVFGLVNGKSDDVASFDLPANLKK